MILFYSLVLILFLIVIKYRFRSIVIASLLSAVAAFNMRSARQTSSSLSMMAERSKSLPFLLRPVKLDGTLAGDEGKRYNIIIIIILLSIIYD